MASSVTYVVRSTFGDGSTAVVVSSQMAEVLQAVEHALAVRGRASAEVREDRKE